MPLATSVSSPSTCPSRPWPRRRSPSPGCALCLLVWWSTCCWSPACLKSGTCGAWRKLTAALEGLPIATPTVAGLSPKPADRSDDGDGRFLRWSSAASGGVKIMAVTASTARGPMPPCPQRRPCRGVQRRGGECGQAIGDVGEVVGQSNARLPDCRRELLSQDRRGRPAPDEVRGAGHSECQHDQRVRPRLEHRKEQQGSDDLDAPPRRSPCVGGSTGPPAPPTRRAPPGTAV
ncbi:hypothetical protein EV578_10174 [Streptomyces sp. BK205]|nr:hypothetical protein EV578_10174 [Streptomyces sp. BK205]